MLESGRLFDQQKMGCPKGLQDFRPITLLNTDYKIFARILAGRIYEVIGDFLHPRQN
jgi:hypothetical protein